jgi:hypothetical protein
VIGSGHASDIWSISTKSVFVGLCFVGCFIVGQVTIFSHVTTSPTFFRFVKGLYYLYFAEKSKYDTNIAYTLSLTSHAPSLTSLNLTLWKRRSTRTRCRLVPNNYLNDVLAPQNEGASESQNSLGYSIEAVDDWSTSKNYSLRCLPNFLFIGASTCGTSSMRTHLVSHPGIRVYSVVEIFVSVQTHITCVKHTVCKQDIISRSHTLCPCAHSLFMHSCMFNKCV